MKKQTFQNELIPVFIDPPITPKNAKIRVSFLIIKARE